MLFSEHNTPVDFLRVNLNVGDTNNNLSAGNSRKTWNECSPEPQRESSVLCTYFVKSTRAHEPSDRLDYCDVDTRGDVCGRKFVEVMGMRPNNNNCVDNYARIKVESDVPPELEIPNSLDMMKSCSVRKSPVPNVRFKGHVIPQIPLSVSYSDDEECKSNAGVHPDSPMDSRCLTANEPVLNIEFDGTTVLCRVCGDKASGFHYGVHSCEGCKGFFRRSIQQKIQYRPCTKNQQCAILRINRNRCQYCRLKKCIAVGMSRDAVRFGRVPKREKARILAAMQQSTNSRSQEKAVAAELEDEQRLLNTVVTAHLDTCEFTREKVAPLLQRARDDPEYTACPPTLACPLNPNPQPLTGQQELLQDFSKRFSPAIRGVVEFAKRIPGFALLPQDDQVTLLKAGVFEVLLVRLACMFNAQNNSMICLNGQVLRRESVHNSPNARFLMNSMFDFAERLNSLHLSDAEIGLFSSIVVIAPDRPGLRNVELIERMQNKLKMALQIVVNQNHSTMQTGNLYHELMKKIADLRTLNTLHSEKLLAFKMTEQQQQLQQQQQAQQQLWGISITEEENCSKSPAGSSSWSSSSDVTMDEVKSPLGSVSSTESMCSGEMNDYSHHNVTSQHAANAPLLAATLAGNICPHRHRANSGSTSGEDDKSTILTIKSVNNNNSSSGSINNVNSSNNRTPFRKLDSPSDSGIESGTEKIDKLTNSAPTSVCSSPRSSLEDDHHHHHQQNHNHIVEDMPVLKRVLQAPPLYDTNSLMDEAYKPHKKFRALRNNVCNGARDSAEAEPMIIINGHSHQNDHQNDNQSSQLHHHLTTSSSSSSLLSSTHSTLAKSLMEGPRMTPEQLKRTDIIHNFIMRGEAPSANFSVYNIPHQSRWGSGNNTSVITTTNRGSNPSSLSPSYNHLLSSASSLPCLEQSSVSQRHLHPQSAPISPSSTSPSLLRMASPVASPTPSNVVEIQVGIANSQQPLNLSKKTPPSSPRPPSANSHKVVTMEA